MVTICHTRRDDIKVPTGRRAKVSRGGFRCSISKMENENKRRIRSPGNAVDVKICWRLHEGSDAWIWKRRLLWSLLRVKTRWTHERSDAKDAEKWLDAPSLPKRVRLLLISSREVWRRCRPTHTSKRASYSVSSPLEGYTSQEDSVSRTIIGMDTRWWPGEKIFFFRLFSDVSSNLHLFFSVL